MDLISLQFCADRVIPEKAIHPESPCCTNFSGAIAGDSTMKRIDISTPKLPSTFALVDDKKALELFGEFALTNREIYQNQVSHKEYFDERNMKHGLIQQNYAHWQSDS